MNYNIYNTYYYSTQYPEAYNMLPNSSYIPPNNSLIQNSVTETKNRFVYVNQNFINAHSTIKPKVLINPNFKQTVHINPNFKNPLKPRIHVNPNVIKLTDTNSVINSTAGNYTTNKSGNSTAERTQPVISTKTKLIRTIAGKKSEDTAKQERRRSLHTKYKIIHASDSVVKDTNLQTGYLRNRYKIDRNILRSKRSPRKANTKMKHNLQNTCPNKKAKYKKASNSKYISINGTLYKKTPNVLKRADLVKITSGKTSITKDKVLLIRGQLYKLDHHQKRLKIFSSIHHSPKGKGTTTLKHKKFNRSVKLNRSKQRLSLSNSTSRVLINRMKKCNMPCPIYRKFGKCKANELGKCIRVHNPDQISLCTRFLQGACFNSKCLLSHKVSLEKMPTCKYFLEGLCSKEDCVYLHVKISAKAEICKDFLEGYCKKGKECLKRHQFLCPDYEKNGSCPKKKCQYPHGNLVRKAKCAHKVAKRIIKKKSGSKLIKKDSVKPVDENEHDKNIRYYIDNCGEIVNEPVGDICESDLVDENAMADLHRLKLLKRSQLGILPSYIPFGEMELLPPEVTI